MALAYDRERLTRDIDAVYAPKSEVFGEAQRMAAERDDLDDGWLNDAMKGFLTGNPDVEASLPASNETPTTSSRSVASQA